jgi:signal transduction histidine kinase
VVLEIADTGAGLSPDELAEIEEFVPGRCSRKAHGTGFGLPIAWRKIRDHGGHLAIASALDEGTTITVTVPLTSQDDNHADCCAPASAAERPGRR